MGSTSLTAPIDRSNGNDQLANRYLHPTHLFYGMYQSLQGSPHLMIDPTYGLKGEDGQSLDLNQWLHDELRSHTATLIASDGRYSLFFDKFELLMHFSAVHYTGHRAPGLFWNRRENARQVMKEIEESISKSQPKDSSSYVTSGIAGDTYELWEEILRQLREEFEKYGQQNWNA